MAEDATARNRARVEAIYAAYLAGDLPAVLDAMAPEIRWVSGEATSGAPWSGERLGRAGVEAYFAALAAACRIVDYRVGRIIADGDWVAVTATVRARFHQTGEEQQLDKVDVLRLRDGQVVEFREFYDTTAIAAACAA
ncbi:nuclear transport factor 2 family protein [Roseomonas sp. JC162]|uniref:Nuclear transport factor 2 family protein n=1 Tax=Neoroseomonas marina TaxID=1232220 RepID=A0A848E6D0_9PROT|nr:nuclear transport factor 2 family protein [Neoroseomonas marina]NMJ39662.1 nuclear transport factor 2 family protein [Neoroseomonas marina]